MSRSKDLVKVYTEKTIKYTQHDFTRISFEKDNDIRFLKDAFKKKLIGFFLEILMINIYL